MQKDILCALGLRFGSPVQGDPAKSIRGMNDRAELGRWFGASLTANSLDDFRAAVQASSD